MASLKQAFGTTANLTITLASLAESNTFIAGRQSTAVDNTVNLYLDYLLSGKITVGTTPTVGTEIRVYVVGLLDDSTWPDTLGAVDAAASITSVGVGSAFLKLAATMVVDAATSNRTYYFGPVSVAQLFGGVLPRKFLVYVSQNTDVNLNSTGSNHQITVTPSYNTAA